jgi:hypothetical protein
MAQFSGDLWLNFDVLIDLLVLVSMENPSCWLTLSLNVWLEVEGFDLVLT